MREKQPRLLVIWSKYELSFDLLSRKPMATTCRRPKCTSSMAGISRSTARRIIFRGSFVASSSRKKKVLQPIP
jgi:hypothetical protein